MQTHLKRRAADIARYFVGIWHDHEQALDEAALPYLDHLMEAVVAVEPLTPYELKSKLMEMVPSMRWGNASRLVEMKYPNCRHQDFLMPEYTN